MMALRVGISGSCGLLLQIHRHSPPPLQLANTEWRVDCQPTKRFVKSVAFNMPDVKTVTVSDSYIKLNGGLLEAPFYEQAKNRLRFVDIVKKHIYFVDLTEGPSSLKQFDLKESFGTTADIEGYQDEIIAGGKRGYYTFNTSTGDARLIKEMWTDEERKDDGGGKFKAGKSLEDRMRSNDGAVDPKGRYLVGAMNDPAVTGDENFDKEGVVFRLDSDLSIHRIVQPVTIPNGTSWSLDNKTIYLTDSPTGKIMAYPYNLETGEISLKEGKTFFTCPYEGCVPDGHCQDENGNFWIAIFGSGKVVQVNTAGEIITIIELPARCVTCPTICGTDLFVTSAQEQEPEKHPESAKNQGNLFKVDIGVHGKPLNKFIMASAI